MGDYHMYYENSIISDVAFSLLIVDILALHSC